MMRSSLITKVGVRKIFTATFTSYGTAKLPEGELPTALLTDVKDHGTIVADHIWIQNPPFSNVGILLPGEKIMFRAQVMPYPKEHHNIKWDIGLTNLSQVRRCVGE
jgi:hypothetical protein